MGVATHKFFVLTLMADHIPREQRSWNMSRIRSRNTKPEMIVRSLVHRSGYRFRLHRKDLPGTPDIVLPRYRTVIFVHGCFWHRHTGCSRCSTPSTNQQYWLPKFQRNVAKDKVSQRQLRRMGWRVVVVWECEVKNIHKLRRKLEKALGSLRIG